MENKGIVELVPSPRPVLAAGGLDVLSGMRGRIALVQGAMRELLREGVDYASVPGIPKPFLHKPGAEILRQVFSSQFGGYYLNTQVIHSDLGNGHREYVSRSDVLDAEGRTIVSGHGSCSTMESKYRWRAAERSCPRCGVVGALLKSKTAAEYFCWAKKGGCGAKFGLDDPEIKNQQIGRVENPDIADQWNTCLKMAKKRSEVDAIISATCASGLFTQDDDAVATPPAPPATPASDPEPEPALPAQPEHDATATSKLGKKWLDEWAGHMASTRAGVWASALIECGLDPEKPTIIPSSEQSDVRRHFALRWNKTTGGSIDGE